MCSQAHAADAPLTLRIALNGSEDHAFVKGVRILESKIEERSNGHIDVIVFPNSMLGAEREMFEQTKMGSIEMFVGAADGAIPAWVPNAQIFFFSYLFANVQEARYVCGNLLYDILEPDFEKAGVKNFGFMELGFRHFTNNKHSVSNADDMQGLVIRVQESPAWQILMERLKATPAPMAVNELYSAMQQGVVDGKENPLSTIVAQKFYEVQKYLVLDGHTYCAGAILMNLDFYNNLSENYKKLISECINETIKEQREQVTKEELVYLEACKDNGMEIVEEPNLESFKNAVAGFGEDEAIKSLFDTSIIERVQEFLKNNKVM